MNYEEFNDTMCHLRQAKVDLSQNLLRENILCDVCINVNYEEFKDAICRMRQERIMKLERELANLKKEENK